MKPFIAAERLQETLVHYVHSSKEQLATASKAILKNIGML